MSLLTNIKPRRFMFFSLSTCPTPHNDANGDSPTHFYSNSRSISLPPLVPPPGPNPNRSETLASCGEPPSVVQEPWPNPRLDRGQPTQRRRLRHIPNVHHPDSFLGAQGRVLHSDMPPEEPRTHPPNEVRQLPEGPQVADCIPRPLGWGHLQQRRRHVALAAQNRRSRIHHANFETSHVSLG